MITERSGVGVSLVCASAVFGRFPRPARAMETVVRNRSSATTPSKEHLTVDSLSGGNYLTRAIVVFVNCSPGRMSCQHEVAEGFDLRLRLMCVGDILGAAEEGGGTCWKCS